MLAVTHILVLLLTRLHFDTGLAHIRSWPLEAEGLPVVNRYPTERHTGSILLAGGISF